eukprot:gene22279-biopygen8739
MKNRRRRRRGNEKSAPKAPVPDPQIWEILGKSGCSGGKGRGPGPGVSGVPTGTTTFSGRERGAHWDYYFLGARTRLGLPPPPVSRTCVPPSDTTRHNTV